jgi:glycosyltransferase involved in cell wall biosynthesis
VERKHIVILGSAHPLRGGLAAYNERIARELIRQGHQVTIFTFSLQYPGFLFPGTTQYSSEPAPKDLDIKVCVNSINPFNWIKTGMAIKKLQPDVLMFKYWLPFMSPCFGTIARIVKGNRKTRIVTILDNIIPHEKRIGDNLLTRYFTSAMDGFISMSKQVMNDLKKFTTSENQLLIPHPIYDNFGEGVSKASACEKLKLDPSVPYLLFFGFIRGYKGLDLLLEAMAQPALKNFPGKLIVAGEFYEEASPYHALIEKYNLKDRLVLHTDFIPDSEVKFYFGAADLVVQPYKTATQSGISQMAYHFEKPMVVTNVGGLPELVPDGECGFVVTPEPKAIAEAIMRFYDEQLMVKFTAHLKEEKKKYSWERMVEGVFTIAGIK